MLNKISKKKVFISSQLKRLKQEIDISDAIIIGAGAGLSISAGFTYSGEPFSNNFKDFEAVYNFHDMYTGGFYSYQTLEKY